MTHRTRALALTLLAGPLTACMGTAPPAAEEVDVSPTRGAALFAASCASCHGEGAAGGAGPDLTTIAARNDGDFPWEHVLSTIDGYGTHGRAMPEFGARDLGPLVNVEYRGLGTPVPADLLSLGMFIDSVQDPPSNPIRR
jgi:mono/diheme cytochrome c family protein